MQIAVTPPSSVIWCRAVSSSIEMQSHSTLPCGVRTSSARCPIAMAGSTPMPSRSGSSSRSTTTWSRASHSRYFWGLRLRLLATLRAPAHWLALTGAKADERAVPLDIHRRPSDRREGRRSQGGLPPATAVASISIPI